MNLLPFRHLCGVACLMLSALTSGCAVATVAGAAVGATVTVASAVVSTGVTVAGKVVEKTIDIALPGQAKP